MGETPTPEKEEFEIQSPGDGAWKVNLWKADGQDSAEFLLLGENALERLALQPGSYLVTAERLGAEEPAISAVHDFHPLDLTIQLRELAQASPANDQTPKEPHRTSISDLMTNVAKHSMMVGSKVFLRSVLGRELAGLSAPNIDVGFADHDITSVFKNIRNRQIELSEKDKSGAGLTDASEPDPAEADAAETSLRYTVGLSEDRSPGEQTGWSVPEGLQVKADTLVNGSLRITVEDDSLRRTRLRMSIGLAKLPTIRIPLPMYRDGIRVRFAPISLLDGSDTVVSMEARNERIQALVAALDQLNSPNALQVVDWASGATIKDAIPVLAEKKDDLWAATVAALVLVRTGRIAEVAQWTDNLSNLAPHISDAPIIAAWAKAAAASENDNISELEQVMLKYIIRSRRLGAPVFIGSNRLAMDMLTSLAGTACSPIVRTEAKSELENWNNRNQRRLFRGPNMMWEQAGDASESGTLPSDQYLIVSQGLLSHQNGFVPVD